MGSRFRAARAALAAKCRIAVANVRDGKQRVENGVSRRKEVMPLIFERWSKRERVGSSSVHWRQEMRDYQVLHEQCGWCEGYDGLRENGKQ